MRQLAKNPTTARPIWSAEHLDLLHKHYPATGTKVLMGLTGRSMGAINDKASKLGIAYVGKAGRPTKAKPVAVVAPAPAHDPRPKASNTLKPLQVAVPSEAPAPVKRSPNTPLLNARIEARQKAQQEQSAKPKPFVTAEQIRKLPATHPARLAWTRAAYHGPAAATEAFHAAMQQAA